MSEESYQNAVVDALYDGILKYKERQLGKQDPIEATSAWTQSHFPVPS